MTNGWWRAPFLALLIGLGSIAPSAAQESSPDDASDGVEAGRLDLVDQTIFVDDDDVQIVLRASGAADTARLRFTIRQPRTTRAAVRSAHQNPPESGATVAFFSCSLAGQCADDQATIEISPGGLATVIVPNELVGELLRRQPGVLPFTVELLSEDGAELDVLSTSLIVLDDDDRSMTIGVMADLLQPVALQFDGTRSLDLEQLATRRARIDARAGLPIAVEVQPETLDALARTNPAALAETIATLSDRELLRHPWVTMDEEAWRLAGSADTVIAHYALGNEQFEASLERQPGGTVRLDADATAATLGLLRTVGTTGVIVTDDQLRSGTVDQTEFAPFQLLDDNGVAINATRVDGDLMATLLDPDPELGAARALAELSVTLMDTDDDRATVLDLNAIDPVTLDVLVAGIDAHPGLTFGTVDDVLNQPLARDDDELVRGELDPVDPPAVGAIAADINAATTSLDALAAMIEPETEPVAAMRTRLRAAVSSDLSLDGALAYTSGALTEVVGATTGIEVAPSDRVTLTDRRTDLPITIVNNQPLPINVEVVLSAEKLRFPDGDELSLRLRPGDNDLVIPVETLASGDARVTATLTSPGGLFELGRGTIDIRSTAISGLGLVISVVALLVLGAWWVRTILRIRRNRSAATVAP